MKEKEYAILSLIQRNGTISSISRLGLSYSQIAELIDSVIKQGYVSLNEGKLEITTLGEEAQTEYRKMRKRKVLPQKKYYKKALVDGRIVLPKKM